MSERGTQLLEMVNGLDPRTTSLGSVSSAMRIAPLVSRG